MNIFGLSVGRSTVDVYTSPHATPDLDPEPALVTLINSAKTSVLVAAYSFTLPTVAQALIAKHQAGVQVRMLADAGEWATSTSQFPAMWLAGLDIRTWGSKYVLMHEKSVIVDGRRVAWGSYNFSTSAEKTNVEVMTITTSTRLAQVLTAQIEAAYAAGKVPS